MHLLTRILFGVLISVSVYGQADYLSDGTLYEVNITTSGMYQLTGRWLIDNTDVGDVPILSDRINILSIGGGVLKHDTEYTATERLTPINILIDDGGDGMMDPTDRIIFYAEGPNKWIKNNDQWEYLKNPYATSNSYIIKLSDDTPVRITTTTAGNVPTSWTNQYTFRSVYHEDLVNLLGKDLSTQGSGQRWFGRELSNLREIDFNDAINLPVSITHATVNVVVAGRSKNAETMTIRVAHDIVEQSWSPVNTGDVEELYARIAATDIEVAQLTPSDPIAISYDKNSNVARLWLDYISIIGSSDIKIEQAPIIINNGQAQRYESDGIHLQANTALSVWDITDPLSPIIRETVLIEGKTILPTGDEDEEYIIYTDEMTLLTPTSASPMENTTIDDHLISDMVIIYPEGLSDPSQRLAQFRSQQSGIVVTLISIKEIYSLYSAGRPDVTAIRNFARDLYRQGKLTSLLLMGDGTYDFRGLDPNLPRETIIPTYETFESLDPLFAFPSDDYFALLDDGEDGFLRGDLDIAVGRIPVGNINEANVVVDKIINYDSNQSTKGAWKSNLVFLADDEDRNLHIDDADRIAEEVHTKYPVFNQDKIYLDAFRQESTAGGNRYPAATRKLNTAVDQGALVINYLGHGGPRGWTQERVLKVDDITSWTNASRLPLVVTATCSFTGFDDPALKTAGELVLLNPVGGAVALFTTVRSVFASKNFRLTQAVFREMFETEQGAYPTIGEIMRRGKNSLLNDNLNGRKFFLIGDPTMRLAIPQYEVATDMVNNRQTGQGPIDTVGALDVIAISGSVLTPLGEIASDYDGVMDITFYDKPSNVTTLANDSQSFRRNFKNQTNIIYRGKVSVESGTWSTAFRVPIDIDYTVGKAKLSYYGVSDDGIEAIGHSSDLVITGSSDTPPTDDQGPDIAVYLNDRNFNSGDRVSSNNQVIADISDLSGINISGAGIGHEITATLTTRGTDVVTQHYTPTIDDPTSGVLSFDISDLDDGFYTLTIKAFDVLNNPSEATITFEVTNEVLASITSVTAAPNPHPVGFRVTLDIKTEVRVPQVNLRIDIHDIDGKHITSSNRLTPNTNGRILASLNTGSLSPGIYMARISINDTDGVPLTSPMTKKLIALK